MKKFIILIISYLLVTPLKASDTCKAMIQANFTVSDVCLGEEAVFNNTSTSDTNVSTFIWHFGDGNISSQREARHLYNDAQIYTILLKVILNNGCTDSIIKVMTVNALPYCAFTVSHKWTQNPTEAIVTATPNANVLPNYEWTYLYNKTSNKQILDFIFPYDSIAKNFKAEKIVLKITNPLGCSAKDSINAIFARIPGSLNSISKYNVDLSFTNPSPSIISIFNSGKDCQFQLTDINGKLVKTGVLSAGSNLIELKSVGAYFLTTTNSKGQYFVNKIIVQ